MPIPERLRPPAPSDQESREYTALCDRIEDAGRDEVGPLLARWNARAGRTYTQPEFRSYYGAVDVETFVGEMLLGEPAFVPDLTYAELRAVLCARLEFELDEALDSYFLGWLDVNLPGADITNLIYWTNHWFGDEAMLHTELTPDQTLAYAMARCGRRLPDAPDVPLPYPMPAK